MSSSDALNDFSTVLSIVRQVGEYGAPDHPWAYSPWHGTHLQNLRVKSSEKHPRLHVTEEAGLEARTTLATSLHSLRQTWDLPVAWLARILRVERQTIYAWMKGLAVTTTSPRHSNAIRLQQLHELAAEWRRLTDVRFSRIHATTYFGTRSLLEWLEQSELDDPLLVEHFAKASQVNKNHELVRTLSQSMYRGPAHPDSAKQRLLDRRFIAEPKE